MANQRAIRPSIMHKSCSAQHECCRSARAIIWETRIATETLQGQPARLARCWTPSFCATSRRRSRLVERKRPRLRPPLSLCNGACQSAAELTCFASAPPRNCECPCSHLFSSPPPQTDRKKFHFLVDIPISTATIKPTLNNQTKWLELLSQS